jgi:hypothetical protein
VARHARQCFAGGVDRDISACRIRWTEYSGGTTQQQPFQTLGKGTSVLKPGETLILRGGRYHEAPEISKRNGTEDRPITISGYEGEEAVLDGSEALDAVTAGPWAKREDGLWQRRLTKPVWQLWMDGKMLMLARWPNVSKNWTEPMDPQFHGRLPEPGTAMAGTRNTDASQDPRTYKPRSRAGTQRSSRGTP